LSYIPGGNIMLPNSRSLLLYRHSSLNRSDKIVIYPPIKSAAICYYSSSLVILFIY